MRPKKASALVGTIALGAALLAASPATAEESTTPEEFFSAVDQYRAQNPTDIEGLDELVQTLGGTLDVSTNATGPTTAVKATEAMAAVDSTSTSNTEAPVIETAASNFPTDVFVVSVTSARHPASTVASVSGQWNWRDDFSGQAAPFDLATLGFSSGCGKISGHGSSTTSLEGDGTDVATLRDSGVSSNAPIWNIDARTSGFVNSADRGTVAVSYDVADCSGSVQAGFIYEGNQGGSLVSVSAGWGALSVSYSSPGLILQKSSTTITI